ncbi:MAG: hypothetical protein ACREHG_06100, partial [Candidatus Saccharimonadales bacterium]
MMSRTGILIIILVTCCAVLSGCGGGSSSSSVPAGSTPAGPLPITLTALVPDEAQEGGAPFALKVMGFDFTKSSKVIWNGSPLPTTFVNSKELDAPVTTADLAPVSVNVTVSTPGYVCNDCGLSFALDAPP